MESNINMIKNDVKERELKPMSGMAMLFINSIGTLVGIALCIAGPAMFDGGVAVLLVIAGVIMFLVFMICFCGAER